MRINYNVTGAQRKELVRVIADTTGAKAEYMKMPTCNYQIDYFTVTKDGALEFDDMADSEEVETVLEAIADAGFEPESQETAESEESADSEGFSLNDVTGDMVTAAVYAQNADGDELVLATYTAPSGNTYATLVDATNSGLWTIQVTADGTERENFGNPA